ncbi:RNA polymerase sigma factor [Rhizobium bangladeshense]|uniref:RNA polymerase sigma factor n=1 Tax=Rhizobium bangladeshense TaxID=1138189 RepID=UPI0007E5B332|nr:RNA polymerase sigma factor [Rhizobium bangladeshense]
MPENQLPKGLFDLRYAAFLETVRSHRAILHRYCARMCGSVLDGEDVMQDVLLEAYRKLDLLKEPRAMKAWLFRIAHNRCLDHIRAKRSWNFVELDEANAPAVLPPEIPAFGTTNAIDRLVRTLPPMERACVLLKDVLDLSLEEAAGVVGNSVGGVKSALHRGRARLAAQSEVSARPASDDPALLALLERYVALFNQRNWAGVVELTSADAHLHVADCYDGEIGKAPYFSEFEKSKTPWHLDLARLDGELVMMVSNWIDHSWRPTYPVRIQIGVDGGLSISDYYACPWLMEGLVN